MQTILITGGTGVIGRELNDKLRSKGYRVAILSRTTRKSADIPHYYWDIRKKTIEKEAIETADYIIHLAGANIGDKRWSKQRRKLIIDSRVESANLLFDKISEARNKPKAFISASAIGYYGTTTSDKIFC
ncbi:MAG TPA: NAD-dependent epimerase/dehydratase family protein, partial [Dysgonamonadaceae bacterium]|nr:NAD-dependent epimerase/dehydratase family protein [Dysgonamonadaceae bacterium]HRU13941.1 NAD-dependent epimerase/dehydratase family protein [Dysgonamonadaceae bacterium]